MTMKMLMAPGKKLQISKSMKTKKGVRIQTMQLTKLETDALRKFMRRN